MKENFQKKRNGKGKEYDKEGNLVFEGEYLNGKRWNGKAEGYDKWSGNKIFEIDYMQGKKWNGKIIDEKDNIICEIINGNGIFKDYEDNYIFIFHLKENIKMVKKTEKVKNMNSNI